MFLLLGVALGTDKACQQMGEDYFCFQCILGINGTDFQCAPPPTTTRDPSATTAAPLSATTAAPIDDCEPNPCLNDGVCTNTEDGFECQCMAGWTGVHCSEGKHSNPN